MEQPVGFVEQGESGLVCNSLLELGLVGLVQ